MPVFNMNTAHHEAKVNIWLLLRIPTFRDFTDILLILNGQPNFIVKIPYNENAPPSGAIFFRYFL